MCVCYLVCLFVVVLFCVCVCVCVVIFVVGVMVFNAITGDLLNSRRATKFFCLFFQLAIKCFIPPFNPANINE